MPPLPEAPAFFRGIIPRPPLSRFIQLIWFVRGTPPAREKILPNGVVEVIINLGPPHRVIDETAPHRITTYRDSWVAGIQRGTILISPVRETDLVGIRFKPGGASALFAFPMTHIRDQVIELDNIDRLFFAELRERLLEAPTDAQKTTIIETALLARLDLDPTRAACAKLHIALRALHRGGDGLSMAALCRDLGVSQKHLIHLFHRHVGLTPKLLARILRFDAVLQALRGVTDVRWADVAARHGYFDQPHLIADFREFAGVTPHAYFRARSEDGAHIIVER